MLAEPKTNGVLYTNCLSHHGDATASNQPGSVHSTYQAGEDQQFHFDSVEDTAAALKRGEFILVLDSTCRENEGDLIIAAEDITPSKMAFLIHHSSGLICAPVSSSVTLALGLHQMVPKSEATETEGTAYTISVDAAKTTTGISAADRALTCKALSDPLSRGDGFRRPGHVFPLQARDGGVRERRGHTEASVEFCRLAGKREVGVLCEVVEEGREIEGKSEREGTGMMRRDGCLRFGRRWGIKVCTIEMLVDFLDHRKIKG